MIINPYRYGSGPPTDPFFANVVSLLHFEGADGSTTFTDVKGKVWTANGNAQITTTDPLVGLGSLLLDGTGDFISTPSHGDYQFGTNDFTVEMMVEFSALAADCSLANYYNGSNSGWAIRYTLANGLRVVTNTSGFNFAWSPSIGVAYRIAVTRASNNLRAFVDGNQIGVTQVSAFSMGAAPSLVIGRTAGLTDYPAARVDEFRITKFVARYTSNYTPVSPFPDS